MAGIDYQRTDGSGVRGWTAVLTIPLRRATLAAEPAPVAGTSRCSPDHRAGAQRWTTTVRRLSKTASETIDIAPPKGAIEEVRRTNRDCPLPPA